MEEFSWWKGWGRPSRPKRVRRFDLIAGKFERRSKPISFGSIKREFLYWHRARTHQKAEMLKRGVAKLEEAFNLMREAHKNQKRKATGEPYEVHPFHVAYWAALSGCPLPVIIAGLLHDVVEDSGIRVRTLDRIFGSEVAYMVERLSTPKYRTLAGYDAERLRGETELERVERIINGVQDEGRIVYPHEEDYHLPEIDHDKRWKESFGDLLVDTQRRRLFKQRGYLNQLDIYAILLKAMDFMHNAMKRQTASAVQGQRHHEKAMRLWIGRFLDQLSPAFKRSIKYFSRLFPLEPRKLKYSWYTRLPRRDKFNFSGFLALPPTYAPTINVHGEEGEKEIDVLFPDEHFGTRPMHRLRLYRKLVERIQKKDPTTTVEVHESLFPPGLASFHVFRIHLGQTSFSQLEQTLRHLYMRYASDPFSGNAAEVRVHGLQAIYDYPLDKDEVSVFVPRKSYRISRQNLLKEFHRAGFGGARHEFVRGNAPFHLFNVPVPSRIHFKDRHEYVKDKLSKLASQLGAFQRAGGFSL